MAISITIGATEAPTQAVMTVYASTSPTAPVAIFTGSLTGYTAVYTSPAFTTGSSSSGLSVGAKAGIGVGVVVSVLVLAALLWFAYTMGKRRSRAAPSNPPEYDGVIHEEGNHSKGTLYSVDSSTPFDKASAIDKAHNNIASSSSTPVEKASAVEKAHKTESSYASDAKV